MDCFLIFSYEILKIQIFFLNFSELIQVDPGQPRNPRPDFLTRSIPGSILITMISISIVFFFILHDNNPTIVIRPNPGVDPTKESGPELHGLTRVNPNQLAKIKKIFDEYFI
jgi:hypothetical protein